MEALKLTVKTLEKFLTVISEHLAKLEQRVEGIVRELKRSGALGLNRVSDRVLLSDCRGFYFTTVFLKINDRTSMLTPFEL